MALSSRAPFAELGSPRLHSLSSAKNRQNGILPDITSPLKQSRMDLSSPFRQTPSSSRKRRAPAVFEDDDAENIDPAGSHSPPKKSKAANDFTKSTAFSIYVSPSKPSTRTRTFDDSPAVPSARKALSSVKPNTTNSTPIALSRGSPKNKRLGLLSKRRASSSPFTRVDPPSFSQDSPVPFSIDAALKGSIPNYTPKPSSPMPKSNHVAELEASMPKSWFFDIYEDTPEQEAANLMEHSAAILDISSDDDCETKRRNEDLECGKENVPPTDFVPMQPSSRSSEDAVGSDDAVAVEPVKRRRMKKILQDAMDEDRRPLGDLPPAEFYGEGCDARSYVTVDAVLDRPSCLSKEVEFSTEEEVAEERKVPAEKEAPVEEASFQILADPKPCEDSNATAAKEILTETNHISGES